MLCPLLYQILYQTVLFALSVNSCWFCPARGETNSSEDLRSVWLPPGIPEETQLGRQVDYERLRLKGSEMKKLQPVHERRGSYLVGQHFVRFKLILGIIWCESL